VFNFGFGFRFEFDDVGITLTNPASALAPTTTQGIGGQRRHQQQKFQPKITPNDVYLHANQL